MKQSVPEDAEEEPPLEGGEAGEGVTEEVELDADLQSRVRLSSEAQKAVERTQAASVHIASGS
jgi:hypothetical protein